MTAGSFKRVIRRWEIVAISLNGVIGSGPAGAGQPLGGSARRSGGAAAGAFLASATVQNLLAGPVALAVGAVIYPFRRRAPDPGNFLSG